MRPHHSRRSLPPPSSRAARILGRDELRLLLLSLTDGRARHGYELIRQIKAFSRGAYVPSSGMVYPALADLADAGLTTATEGEGGRKLYSATAQGIAEATRRAEEIDALRARPPLFAVRSPISTWCCATRWILPIRRAPMPSSN
jgi:DNA-binding PadR family transcriptional regulator